MANWGIRAVVPLVSIIPAEYDDKRVWLMLRYEGNGPWQLYIYPNRNGALGSRLDVDLFLDAAMYFPFGAATQAREIAPRVMKRWLDKHWWRYADEF